MGKPFFAYILCCADGRYYVGHTDDLERRMAEHMTGEQRPALSLRRPVSLVWSQEFPSREEVLRTELQIKKWSHAKKEALIRNDFAGLHEAAKKRDWAGYRERNPR